MIFRVVTETQRTDEWRHARLGYLTGSCVSDIHAKVQRGEAAARRNLRLRLVLERLTQQPQEDGFQSAEMKRGIELEAEALHAYEALTGNLVRACGFLAHPELMAGCSLDGQIGNFTGTVEAKCPKSATHLSYLRSGEVPFDYLCQVRHGLWLTGAWWSDFVSYDPRFPKPLRLLVTRVTMSQAERDSYELMVRGFLREVDNEYAEVSRLAMAAVA